MTKGNATHATAASVVPGSGGGITPGGDGNTWDMARLPHITVEPRPDNRWAVQKDGAQAKREGAELVVKGRDGKILRRDSHGADSARRPG